MTHFGKTIMLAGAAIALIGAILWVLGRLGFRGLPGDLSFGSDKFKIYVPIATCLVLSIVLSGVVWLFRMLGR